MSSLSNLPSETLALILEYLAESDLATLILAQRVCKRFHGAIDRILFHKPPFLSHPIPAPVVETPKKVDTRGSDSESESESESDGDTGSDGESESENESEDCFIEEYKDDFADIVTALPPLLQRNFGPLFDSTAILGLPPGAGSSSRKPPTEVFRRLPWVAKRCDTGDGVPRVRHMRECPFLRPEASWRRLSATWGLGEENAIKNLDVIKVVTVYGGTGMSFDQLEIPKTSGSEGGEETGEEEGGLTLGLLYDLLASGKGHSGQATMHWRVLPNRRLSSYDGWLRVRDRERYPRTESIEHLFVPEMGSAVLYVKAHRSCTMGMSMGKRIENPDDVPWYPRVLGKEDEVVLHMWKGCKPEWKDLF
ncbi:uncharacterized protein F4822DRAFT_77352 [Hypoxylon trugodes]|uniref:uncharacterized protein n=1 Tax=Hypoxylon trugodes TaxID=326681 RepID=UPI0021A229C6|nr:uncharacterized protein F4822DRAFT_77352 [Hypoxylon trugodes]KAI1383421.1 hypothetical protein F4822DRAFT_77352 [Hypoxylon trugodes]